MAKKIKKSINWTRVLWLYVLAFVAFALLTILPHILKDVQNINYIKIIIQLIATMFLLFALGAYVYFADKTALEQTRKLFATIVTMIISYCAIWLGSIWEFGYNIVPFALCSLVLSLIVSTRTGFFANFVVIMLYFMQAINWQTNATLATENFFYILFSGLIEAVFTAFILGGQYRRIKYIGMGLAIGLVSAICAAMSYVMFAERTAWDLMDVVYKLVWSFASGIVSILLMFMLVPILERLFNIVSIFRYAEIATSDTELMRQLFQKAPGTYNHSLTVANYAEACAVAIGQSAVEARAAAYYHDIGKMKNPAYFAENQFSGTNPHDAMTPEASVTMIKMHATYGLALAKEHNLPPEVQSAIIEHHGTLPLKYFYLKAKKYTDGFLPYDGYCYEGPKPQNKISAILMICDACESALRASNDVTLAEKIVDDIVKERLEFEQFSECDITMKEIDIIKTTILTTYLGIKHKRVKYPDVKMESDK